MHDDTPVWHAHWQWMWLEPSLSNVCDKHTKCEKVKSWALWIFIDLCQKMEEWDYDEDKIPTDRDEDADCCHLFMCFWVRTFKRDALNIGWKC